MWKEASRLSPGDGLMNEEWRGCNNGSPLLSAARPTCHSATWTAGATHTRSRLTEPRRRRPFHARRRLRAPSPPAGCGRKCASDDGCSGRNPCQPQGPARRPCPPGSTGSQPTTPARRWRAGSLARHRARVKPADGRARGALVERLDQAGATTERAARSRAPRAAKATPLPPGASSAAHWRLRSSSPRPQESDVETPHFRRRR